MEREDAATSPRHPLTVGYIYSLDGVIVTGPEQIAPGGCHPPRPRVAAWLIAHGEITGIDLSGLGILAIWSDTFAPSSKSSMLILDERATPEQAQAVREAFSGRHGGPLVNLFGNAASQCGFLLVPLEFIVDDRIRVTARNMVTITVDKLTQCGLENIGEISISIPDLQLSSRAANTDISLKSFRLEHPMPNAQRGT